MISLLLLAVLILAACAVLSGCAAQPVASATIQVEAPARPKITLRAIGGDLALGDSIAVGTGGALGVRTVAWKSMGSCWIAQRVPGGYYDRVVVSAGVNDPPGACVASIRHRLHAGVVVWLVGASRRHREAGTVLAVAAAHGDRVVRFAVGADGVHPRSYPEVAGQVRRAW